MKQLTYIQCYYDSDINEYTLSSLYLSENQYYNLEYVQFRCVSYKEVSTCDV